MARVGEEFPLQCPNCGGDIRLISFITDPGHPLCLRQSFVDAYSCPNLVKDSSACPLLSPEVPLPPALFRKRSVYPHARRFDVRMCLLPFFRISKKPFKK